MSIKNYFHQACQILDKVSVLVRKQHIIGPSIIGKGKHDCALQSLYWTVPRLSERQIEDAFLFCTKDWPYGGVTNKEFQIVLKFLAVQTRYHSDRETLESVLRKKPIRCIALLPYHYIAIIDGQIVGNDAYLSQHGDTTVYCHWVFH